MRGVAVVQVGHMKQESKTRSMGDFNSRLVRVGPTGNGYRKDLDMTDVAKEQWKEGRDKN